MGYGMPWHEFEELYQGECEAHETLEHLLKKLGDADDALLTVDDETYERWFYGNHVPPIWEKRILALSDTDGGRRPSEPGSAEALVQLIWNPADDDDPEYVLFFPSVRHARRWYRRSDEIDITFDRWRGGTGRQDGEPWDVFVKQLPWGHDPFANYLMLADGTPVPWTYYRDVVERDDVLPAVPSEYRFWLPRLGILDDAGVNHLRPLIAQWSVS